MKIRRFCNPELCILWWIFCISDTNKDKVGLSEYQNDHAAEFDPSSLNECQNNIKTEQSEDQNVCNPELCASDLNKNWCHVKMEQNEDFQGFCVPEEDDSEDSEQGSQLSGKLAVDLQKPFNDIHNKWVLLQYQNLTLRKIM